MSKLHHFDEPKTRSTDAAAPAAIIETSASQKTNPALMEMSTETVATELVVEEEDDYEDDNHHEGILHSHNKNEPPPPSSSLPSSNESTPQPSPPSVLIQHSFNNNHDSITMNPLNGGEDRNNNNSNKKKKSKKKKKHKNNNNNNKNNNNNNKKSDPTNNTEKKKSRLFLRLLCIPLAFFLAATVLMTMLYWLHPGVRRSIQFWNAMTPIMFKYKYTVLKGVWIDGHDIDSPEMAQTLHDYHAKTAPLIFKIILRFGGIFVKIGQIISTVGTGFIPDAYIDALRPLQDGVPAKPYSEVKRILETTTGQSMDELFESFEQTPIGAASIAQAHRAVLKDEHQQVVIKIQYPEVADLFALDFSNVRSVSRIVNPENLELLDSLRKRYDNELDFRSEADHLREIKLNMQAHNVEPNLVVIPSVLNDTGLCSRNIIALEYLQGISMKSAIQTEQHRMAVAVGKTVDELRQMVIARMREQHNHADRSEHALGFPVRQSRFLNMWRRGGGQQPAKLLQRFGPAAARVLRFYGRVKDFFGGIFLTKQQRQARRREKRQQPHVNLGRAIKTLVYVHGLQMLRDGVFNVDPHPGNVLILPDGRLGLLDYGMVGRIDDEDRSNIARTLLALAAKNKTEVARIYNESGYRTKWKGELVTDVNILYRFASLNMDRLDLSPVTTQDHQKIDFLQMLQSSVEQKLPPWMEKARRMGALMLGTASQAARPVSLAHEWADLAKETLREQEQKKQQNDCQDEQRLH